MRMVRLRPNRIMGYTAKYNRLSTVRLIANLKQWSKKGFWAVADQALFSSSNFVLSLLLARWLLPEDYGIFTVAFTVCVFVGVLHSSLLTEPMMVFGPGRYENRLTEYVRVLLYGHVAFVLLSSLLLLAASLGFELSGSSQIATALMVLALTTPLIYFLWLMRWACYTRLAPRMSALGGGLYMALMLGGTFTLYWRGWLSAVSAFVVMGVSSLVVGIWLAGRLGVHKPISWRDELIGSAVKRHWEYGRWSLATRILYWTPANIYYLLLPVWWGFEASGSLKALTNLILPILTANIALSALLTSSLARARAQKSTFRSTVRYAFVPFVIGPIFYWVLLGVLHEQIVAFIYDGKYSENAELLWFVGLVPVASGVIQVMSSALRALERPDRLFWAYIPSTMVALTFGVLFVLRWGTNGAALALTITYAATAVAVSIVYLRSEE